MAVGVTIQGGPLSGWSIGWLPWEDPTCLDDFKEPPWSQGQVRMSEERQTHLEEIVAHQQQLIDELNEVVTGQRLDMDRMQLRLHKLEAKIKLLGEYVERSGDDLPHEKPPHY